MDEESETYDTLFHLALKVGFSKTKIIKEFIIIETINITQSFSNDQTEPLEVPMNRAPCTLNELLNNTLNNS